MENKDNITFKYYLVGDRPVKAKYKNNRLKGYYAFNHENNEFELDQTYLSKIRNPWKQGEIEAIETEEEFNKKVEGIKARKKRKKIIKPKGPSM
ncbi:MAG: hypothetical protein N4A43_02275 [Alphaproteobacteria bacterium]|jgi:hypothetical protein|nr:hypothetical protein [Alphaproteobacteria bacterium]